MKTYQESLHEMMQNPEFKKEFEERQPEIDMIRDIVDARISKEMTQNEDE